MDHIYVLIRSQFTRNVALLTYVFHSHYEISLKKIINLKSIRIRLQIVW